MATITLRLDDALKKSFAKTCNELGLDMTTACTIFVKKMTREKRIPFEVSYDPFFEEHNVQAIQRSMEQLANGKTVTKTMAELEALENE